MRHPFFTFVELTYPIFIAVGLVAIIFFIKLDKEQEATISVPFVGGSINLPTRSVLLIRVVLGITALCFLLLPAFKDYSRFFPTNYMMDIFFDDRGIEKSLEVYTEDELDALRIAKDWKKQKKAYLQNLTKDISTYIGIEDFFSKGPENVHSTGQTTFIVDKVEGWQKYYIREAVGALKHELEIPNNKPPKTFHSSFQLLMSADSYIEASLQDIYFRWTKILKPHFKQIATLTPDGGNTIYHHNLIAYIKIRFFPIANIGNTTYLVEGAEKDTFVPIGYAIYKPSK